ncbi:MAG: DUF885 family protein [Gemmatimonadales bacterium]
MRASLVSPLLTVLFAVLPQPLPAQNPPAVPAATGARVSGSPASYAPAFDAVRRTATSELRDVVDRYATDHAALLRRYTIGSSPARRAALRSFDGGWQAQLATIGFDSLSQDGKVDWLLLRNEIERELADLTREDRRMSDLAPLVPFADTVYALDEARREMGTIDPAALARTLSHLAEDVTRARRAAEARPRPDTATAAGRDARIAAYRAAAVVTELRGALDRWYHFYDGYDPMFTWWSRAPWQRADSALRGYTQVLRERLVGVRAGDDEPIVGLPIGRQAIAEDLVYEMIPYTPEQLIAIAQREFTWCEGEMRRAARDMGLGDDWRAALERVKNDYVPPGRQTDLVRDLAFEAERYVTEHDLVTVPPLAADLWRMEMLSPERQKESPFFLGGEVVQVSYPTDAMSEDDKLMSMRGNNIHFARATVFHELIPGHELQGFMNARYNAHRRLFGTPFWNEGNSFYWELRMWDLGFTSTPMDRVGALFWRMHRAARIIFSLGFHLGTMTPQQAIDFLVDRVGHERANATAEVRRSFNGSYPPLYQLAYMVGAFQFRALHQELVVSGGMSERAFHDAILKSGPMPIEMLRALLTQQPLTREFRPSWLFEGAVQAR